MTLLITSEKEENYGILITSEEAEQVMSMPACLAALEQSFRELAEGWP